MTDKQKAFVDEYLTDLNATRAYRSVYKTVKSDEVARKAASRLLTNVDIKARIDEQLEKISNSKVADAKEVMEYLTSVLRGEEKEEIAMVVSDGDFCSSIAKEKKEVSPKDKLKAAELLGKRYRLFVDKIEADVTQVVVFGGEESLED